MDFRADTQPVNNLPIPHGLLLFSLQILSHSKGKVEILALCYFIY